MSFSAVCVIGVGLIGGSFAAACKRLDDSLRVVGVDTDPDALAFALKRGLIDEGAMPTDASVRVWLGPGAVASGGSGPCDLVVLATSASAAEEWMRVLGESGYEGVVTDVASTKLGVLAAAQSYLKGPATYVGGHPMAGSEACGVEAARANLFDGAYYVLTPAQDTDMSAYQRLHSFITALGARVISVDAAAHDEAVAIISHVPHVTASALVDLAKAHAGERDELLRLAAGGFKDTTRIAAGSPDLWTGICLDNADALVKGIEELRQVLGNFAQMVRERDAEAVRKWLAHAADVRRALPTQWVPATERLTEVIIPIIDRPGVVSEVTTAVGRAGCNIEAIEIDHQSEDRALLVLVLTDEGDIGQLVSDLTARGYEPRVLPLEPSE